MTTDALPVSRRGVTRWVDVPEWGGTTVRATTIVQTTDDPAPPLRDLLDLTDHEITLAAIGLLDLKLAAFSQEQERQGRVLDRLAMAVDARIDLT